MSDHDDDLHDHQATVVPYIGPGGLDADAVRDIADQMEAGEVEAVAFAAVRRDGDVSRYHEWSADGADLWALLGALDYISHRIRHEIDDMTGEHY